MKLGENLGRSLPLHRRLPGRVASRIHNDRAFVERLYPMALGNVYGTVVCRPVVERAHCALQSTTLQWMYFFLRRGSKCDEVYITR